MLQTFQYPVERQIRQARIVISASNIRVRARKPSLLHALISAVPGLGPHGGLELEAVLVDGERVAGVVDDAAHVGVVELQRALADAAHEALGDAERADGVEHA